MKPEERFGWGMLVLIFIVVMFMLMAVFGCTKEYSCEACGGKKDTLVAVDTVKDTVISNMVAYYDIYIVNNKDIKVIYPEYTSKYHPDTYLIMDSLKLKLDITQSSTYRDSIDLRKHLPRNEVYKKGDKFLLRMEVRHRFGDIWYTDSTYLVY